MAEWRVVYAGLREMFPQLDKAVVRAAAQRYLNEEDAVAALLGGLPEAHAEGTPRGLAEDSVGQRVSPVASQDTETVTVFQEDTDTDNVPAEAATLVEASECAEAEASQMSQTVESGPLSKPATEIKCEEVDIGKPSEPHTAGEALSVSEPGVPQDTTNSETGLLESWNPYLEAAVSAAKPPLESELQGLADTPMEGSPLEALVCSGPQLQDAPLTETNEMGSARDLGATSAQEKEGSSLEILMQHSMEEKEKLAAELAAFADLRDTAIARETEVEAAKERIKVAGAVERQQMETNQQALARLREENERRCGEVNGELAMLATESAEMRRNLAFLQEERTAIKETLGQLRTGLDARVASAEAAIAAADAEADERRAIAQAALEVVEAKMAAAQVEKADLDRQEAEANQLHLFIMEKGTLVDSMLAEVAMLHEDLTMIEQLALGSGYSGEPIRSSFLSVGQAGSILRRSSHSQRSTSTGMANATPPSERQAEVADAEDDANPARVGSSVAGVSEGGDEGPPELLSGSSTSAGGSERSLHASLPSLLSQSAHSGFHSANSSGRLSQALVGDGSNSVAVGEPQLGLPLSIGESRDAFDVGAEHAGHMGLYGPSPSNSNLTSQYMGVFQQRSGHWVEPLEHDEQRLEEGWSMLDSDSGSSGTHL